MINVKPWNLTDRALVEDGYTILAQGDVAADSFGVTGEGLTGLSASANFIRADGVTVQLAGTVSNNIASVSLTEECLYYDGAFTLALFLADSSRRHTARVISGRVVRTVSERILDKGAVYDVAALRAEIAKKVTAPAGTGSAGDVLISDGHGGTSWGDPASATAAGILTVNGSDYQLRTGTGGASGFITLVPEA